MTFAEMLEELRMSAYFCGLQDAEYGADSEEYKDPWSAVAILAHEQALRERIAELKEELRVTDFLLVSREEVLRAIPECPEHGRDCVPHALDWIGAQVGMKP